MLFQQNSKFPQLLRLVVFRNFFDLFQFHFLIYDDFQNQEKIEQKKQLEFSEKIDELNQETDTLLDEIDKWQT